MPPGKKDDLSLREKERQIERDMEDSIKTGRDAKITLNQMFETYMTGKISLKQSTRTNYIYMYTHYVQDGFGKKMLKDIRYSDVKAFYNSLIVEKGFKANSMEIIKKVIQDIMGHADITTTMNIYAEATKEKKREAMANLNGKIKIM